MNCSNLACNKEIQEAQFFVADAIQHSPLGNKIVNVLLPICSECVEKHRLTDKVVGNIKIIESACV